MPFQKQLKESGVLSLEKGILVVVVIIEGGVNRGRETTFIVCILKTPSICYIRKIRYAASEARIQLLKRNYRSNFYST